MEELWKRENLSLGKRRRWMCEENSLMCFFESKVLLNQSSGKLIDVWRFKLLAWCAMFDVRLCWCKQTVSRNKWTCKIVATSFIYFPISRQFLQLLAINYRNIKCLITKFTLLRSVSLKQRRRNKMISLKKISIDYCRSLWSNIANRVERNASCSKLKSAIKTFYFREINIR